MEISQRITVNEEKCTGCRSCEIACSFNKYREFNPSKSSIRIVKLEEIGFSNPIICRQCAKPRCVEVCPVAALQKNDSGVISLNKDKCVGCGICAEECIIGAVPLENEKSYPLICDLCGGEPNCIKWCPTEALVLTNDATGRKKKYNYTTGKAERILKKWGIPEKSLRELDNYSK